MMKLLIFICLTVIMALGGCGKKGAPKAINCKNCHTQTQYPSSEQKSNIAQ